MATQGTYETSIFFDTRFNVLYSENPDIGAELVETSVLLSPRVAIQFLTDVLRALDPSYSVDDGVEALTDETIDVIASRGNELDATCAILRAYDALTLSYLIHNPMTGKRYLFNRLLGIA